MKLSALLLTVGLILSGSISASDYKGRGGCYYDDVCKRWIPAYAAIANRENAAMLKQLQDEEADEWCWWIPAERKRVQQQIAERARLEKELSKESEERLNKTYRFYGFHALAKMK